MPAAALRARTRAVSAMRHGVRQLRGVIVKASAWRYQHGGISMEVSAWRYQNGCVSNETTSVTLQLQQGGAGRNPRAAYFAQHIWRNISRTTYPVQHRSCSGPRATTIPSAFDRTAFDRTAFDRTASIAQPPSHSLHRTASDYAASASCESAESASPIRQRGCKTGDGARRSAHQNPCDVQVNSGAVPRAD